MPLSDYVVQRDKFELDRYIVNNQMHFPCNQCIHNNKKHDVEPCRTCDHNIGAVPEDDNA